MKPESPIKRIRDVRERIAAMCEHDPDRIVDDYMELQKHHQARIAKAESLAVKEPSAPYKASNE